jgi:hypothetical protein
MPSNQVGVTLKVPKFSAIYIYKLLIISILFLIALLVIAHFGLLSWILQDFAKGING